MASPSPLAPWQLALRRVAPRPGHLEPLLAVGLIAVAAWAFTRPMGWPPRIPAGHDHALAVHLARAMAEGLGDGVLYPRWLDHINYGYGLPALVGYPPLGAFWVGATSHLVGDLAAAFAAVVLGVSLASGLSTYMLARRFARPAVAGLAGALYVLMPYHFVVVYHRFAFAEFTGALWLPLVLHYGLALRARPSLGGALGLAASFAATVVSHVIVAQMALIGLGIPVLIASRPWRRPGRAATMLAALLGAGLLVAAYLLPAVVSRELTHTGSQYRPGRTLPFLFRGGALDGFQALVHRATEATALAAAPLLAALFGRPAARVVAAGALITFAMHLRVSEPVWRHVPGMEYVLYPLRFGLLAALFAPLALAWASRRSAALTLIGALGCAAALVVSSEALRGASYVDEPLEEVTHWNTEHVPRTVASPLPGARPPPAGVRMLGAGGARAELVARWSHGRRVRVRAPRDATLEVAAHYYPGWTATLDGAPAPIEVAPVSGLLRVAVPAGAHEVELRFVETPDRRLGRWVSTVALLAFAALLGLAVLGRLARGRPR